MTKYTLTYWNAQGRAEPIRLIFAAANVKFNDNRISKESWPALKQSMPWSQVPILEFDGKVIAQSMTICRYLARSHKLAGSNEWESAKCDEYVDVLTDILEEMKTIVHTENDMIRATRKGIFLQETLPKCLNTFQQLLGRKDVSSFLVGKKLTWADIVLTTMLDRFETPAYAGPSLLDNNYANLKMLRSAVYNYPGIKEYVENRPREYPL